MKTLITILALVAANGAVPTQNAAVGLWKTIADDGKTEQSLVYVTDHNGTLSGRIEQLFDPAQQAATCANCNDERKGQPLVGLTIIRNVKADAGEPDSWSGGEILDPGTGRVFKLRLKALDGGKKMEMRAYGGPLYRSQIWVRVQ